MPHLPTGTVTFLLTDIESSTTLWEQHPTAMRQALVQHDTLVEQIVAEHHGQVVRPRGEGDSRFAVFARASDAVAAAAALQQALHAEPWPAQMPLRVRMALHTGEADLREGDYYGSVVNRCARLRAVAHGGQTLVSAATQELVRDSLPSGFTLRDLGEHRLKDLIRPEQIFQLLAFDLPRDFPPLRILDRLPNNLPLQPTPLIGREQEVAAVRQRLLQPDVRLVTLTGPGGTGKTRLALQAAAELLDDFPDGVFFVDLAPLSDPALVLSSVGAALGVPETGDQSLQERLAAYLHPRQLLLLLDNFEQVMRAARLVAALLQAAPRLNVLITSRAPLHLRGEREFPVPPLGLPDPLQLPALDRLRQYEAVALFIARAQDVKPDFEVTNAIAPAVAEICARLDGLPLAIELAAARVKVLPPAALLARLEHRLRVLTGGARELEARQQTLRGAIDWSYELLTTEEQTVFAWLGIFVGGFTMEAAEAVCSAGHSADEALEMDVLEGVASLVNKSLVRQVEDAEGEPRFTMLETIREYAQERLAASGESEIVGRRHAAYYIALGEQAEPQSEGRHRATWLQRLKPEVDNLRAAFHWTLAASDATLTDCRRAGSVAQRIFAHQEAIALLTRGLTLLEHLSDGPQRAAQELSLLLALASSIRVTKGWPAPELEQVLTRASDLIQPTGEPDQRIRILVGQCNLYLVRGDLERTRILATQLLGLADAEQTPLHVLGWTLLACASSYSGALRVAQGQLAQCIQLYDPRHHLAYATIHGVDTAVLCLSTEAHNLWCLGYPDQALSSGLKATSLADDLAHPFSQALATVYLALLHQLRGESGATFTHATAAHALASEHAVTYYRLWSAILLATTQAGHQPEAAELSRLRQALAAFRDSGAGLRWPYYLSLLAQAYARAGQVTEGRAVLAEALATSARTHERWWDAELHRLDAELLLQDGGHVAEAEAHLEQALALARGQQARSLELRAATSLARLWQKQGRTEPARQVLSGIYGWFTEGFDTPDLVEARSLLASLA